MIFATICDHEDGVQFSCLLPVQIPPPEIESTITEENETWKMIANLISINQSPARLTVTPGNGVGEVEMLIPHVLYKEDHIE